MQPCTGTNVSLDEEQKILYYDDVQGIQAFHYECAD